VTASLLKSKIVGAESDGMLDLLAFSFVACYSTGSILLVVQLLRRRGRESLFGWFARRRRESQFGPIAVSPFPTPRMRAESTVFTILYCILVALGAVIGAHR
jgi:hypothetical protein